MRYDYKHIMPGPYEHRPDAFTDAEAVALWPSAAAELTGFADHLAAEAAAITAGQIRLAVWLAEREHRMIAARMKLLASGKVGLPEWRTNLVANLSPEQLAEMRSACVSALSEPAPPAGHALFDVAATGAAVSVLVFPYGHDHMRRMSPNDARWYAALLVEAAECAERYAAVQKEDR